MCTKFFFSEGLGVSRLRAPDHGRLHIVVECAHLQRLVTSEHGVDRVGGSRSFAVEEQMMGTREIHW